VGETACGACSVVVRQQPKNSRKPYRAFRTTCSPRSGAFSLHVLFFDVTLATWCGRFKAKFCNQVACKLHATGMRAAPCVFAQRLVATFLLARKHHAQSAGLLLHASTTKRHTLIIISQRKRRNKKTGTWGPSRATTSPCAPRACWPRSKRPAAKRRACTSTRAC
jgi:hypothetical protein